MPRRARPTDRKRRPDRKYGNPTLQQFNNNVMRNGKRSTAEGIVYSALTLAETSTRKPGIDVFETAMRNAMPLIEVKPRRVGGATYQVPVEIRADRRTSLAMRWIIQAARKRPGKSMAERLAGELMDAMNNTGGAVRRKEETHKMAEANKAFSHYKWKSLCSSHRRSSSRPSKLGLSASLGGSGHARNKSHQGSAGRARVPARALPEHRDHRAHRRRQDDSDRADPLLHQEDLQDGRGPRGRRDHGLDAAGAGTRHHDHGGGHDLLLERPPHQHHRHARPR